MRSIILSSLILSSFVAIAQPGYMSKRMSFAYGFDFFPMVSQLTPTKEYATISQRDQSSSSEKFITITKGHHLSFSYVVNRKLELLAEGTFRSNDYYMNNLPLEEYEYFQPDVLTRTGVERYIEFGVRKYIADFIAPVGLYSQFTFGTCKVQYKEDMTRIPGKYEYSNNVRDTINVVTNPLEFKRFSYAFGVKRMLSDAIFFQGDMNFHLTFPFMSMKDLQNENGAYATEDYAKANLLLNFNSYKWFDLKLVVGILL